MSYRVKSPGAGDVGFVRIRGRIRGHRLVRAEAVVVLRTIGPDTLRVLVRDSGETRAVARSAFKPCRADTLEAILCRAICLLDQYDGYPVMPGLELHNAVKALESRCRFRPFAGHSGQDKLFQPAAGYWFRGIWASRSVCPTWRAPADGSLQVISHCPDPHTASAWLVLLREELALCLTLPEYRNDLRERWRNERRNVRRNARRTTTAEPAKE